MTDLVEKVARAIALFFTPNTQPDMSGDPMAKLLPHQKRAAREAAHAAIIATLEAMQEQLKKERN